MKMKPLNFNETTDAHLLTRFAEERDHEAFAELVRRHGPMVLGTTRQVLTNSEDSQDAFQAVFMSLAKSAAKLRNKKAVAAWLHSASLSCARNVASSSKRWKNKRDRLERHLAEQAAPLNESDLPDARVEEQERMQLLHEELARLPSKLYSVLALCELEGVSQKEAAVMLGIAPSTVKDRIVKGRELLRKRLMRRGAQILLIGVGARLLQLGADAVEPSLVKRTTDAAIEFSAKGAVATTSASIRAADAANTVITRHLMTNLPIGYLLMSAALLLTAALGWRWFHTSPEAMIVEDFSNGAVETLGVRPGNAGQVNWVPTPLAFGDAEQQANGLVLRARPSPGTFGLGAKHFITRDVSILAQVRVAGEGDVAWVVGRNQPHIDAVTGYTAAVAYEPQFGGSFLTLIRNDGRAGTGHFFPSTNGDVVHQLSHDVRIDDTIVQLDITGDEIRAWAWKAGETRPDAPQFFEIDRTWPEAGYPAFGTTERPAARPALRRGATFRFVRVAERASSSKSITFRSVAD